MSDWWRREPLRTMLPWIIAGACLDVGCAIVWILTVTGHVSS